MKLRVSQFASILIIILLSIPVFALAQSKANESKNEETQKNEIIRLFNGNDLSNWVFYLKDASIDPATVFTVKNGVINISGNPFGYMRTKETYSDYKLHVEWRWPSEATNSGVFVHAQIPDTIWIKCIECQLKAGSAGDFVCMNGGDMDEHINKAAWSVSKLSGSSEKPVGEWNTMEVICKGKTIEVFVNGILQNKGTNLNLSSGSICLQSEGKDIEFRNVFIGKL